MSLRAEILEILARSGRCMTQPEIYAELPRKVNKNVFAVTIAQMLGSDLKRRRIRRKVPGRLRYAYWSKHSKLRRHWWVPKEDRALRTLYPHLRSDDVGRILGRTVSQVYARARVLGLEKSAAYNASTLSGRMVKGFAPYGHEHRFKKGQVPANKGLRRPGWYRGRMRETQFKKGQFPPNRDPDFYVIGALRVNHDGYIDMRVSFEHGSRGWRGLHLVLWEDAHGPLPAGHCLWFKDRDRLNVELDNIELITRAENCRRNSIHKLPKELKQTVRLLGQLKRRIRERHENETRDQRAA